MKQTGGWTIRQMLRAAVVMVSLLAVVWLCWRSLPWFRELLSRSEEVRLWAQEHKMTARLLYAGAVLLQVLLAIIPGEPLEIIGGYVFGVAEGTILCLVAAAVGSMLVFTLVRRFGERLVTLFFSREKLKPLHFLQSSPKRLILFWIIYMTPGTPKDLLSYYAGLTDIKAPVFLMMCSMGRLPSLVTSTLGGDALGMNSYLFAVVVFAVTLFVSGIGLLIYDRICKHHKQD